MKKNSIRVLLATLCLGTVIAGCESKENVDTVTKEETEISGEAADLQPTEAVAEEPTKEAEETPTPEEEETAEEGFVFPDPMPEIVNASFVDGKIQVCDMIVDMFDCNYADQLLDDEALKQEKLSFYEEHKMGTAQELYEHIQNWGWFDKEYDLNQMVLNETVGIIGTCPPDAASGCPRLIEIVYFNNSGEMKRLGDCDAFVVSTHISDSRMSGTTLNQYDAYFMRYVYVAGGINSEDPYWNYTTLTDYLKANGIEYREKQSGSNISIRFKVEDVVERLDYDGESYEMTYDDVEYSFRINASNMDLERIDID